MNSIIALDLIEKLCETLLTRKINYCHWKSNYFLDRSANGDNDLDLLVSRQNAHCFTEIMYGLGFKEVLSPQEEELPGVRNFYGFDQKSGKLIHVHAHYQLILGNDLSKNYRLPIEQAFLASSIQTGLFRVPAPEFELAVLVLRMILKHSTWDSLLMLHGQLSSSERCELENLSTVENLAKIEHVLPHLPGLSQELFDQCMLSLRPNSPIAIRIKTGEQLQKTLCADARRSHLADLTLKLSRRIWHPVLKHGFKYSPKNCCANGGLFIAICGGDGSGKTTVIKEINQWLSKIYNVKTVHMGKPAWSWTTIALRGILKLGTLLRLYRFEGDVYEESQLPHQYPWYIRAVCTARDRYLTYLHARRDSTNGYLVLSDRYSLPGFMSMDGPQCEAALAGINKTNRFLNFLINKENSYYAQIKKPDLLIVLKARPEIAVQRKVDETEASVRARSAEVWNLDWEKLSALPVDANLTKEEVLSQVKNIVWEYI